MIPPKSWPKFISYEEQQWPRAFWHGHIATFGAPKRQRRRVVETKTAVIADTWGGNDPTPSELALTREYVRGLVTFTHNERLP